MFVVSPLLDAIIKFRLSKVAYRKAIYQQALNRELRNSKLGTIILRNLNEQMSLHPNYHNELIEWFGIKDYQKTFWESDLGYLWYSGNFKGANPYFEEVIRSIDQHKYNSHLDIGCGWGELNYLAAKCKSIEQSIGIDISASIIDQAKERNNDPKIKFVHQDFSDYKEPQVDIISLIGATDYIEPGVYKTYLEHMLQLAKKEIVIMNSLRGVDFDEMLKLSNAVQTKRYDVGYVQATNTLLKELQTKFSFTFSIVRAGKESYLAKILKQ